MRNSSLYHKVTVFKAALLFTAYKCERFHCAKKKKKKIKIYIHIWCGNKNLLKCAEVQKVPAKPLHSTLEKPVGFLTHFFLSICACLCLEFSPVSFQAAFFFCIYTALRAVGCWSMTKAPECSPNTDNNKSRERSILRTVHLWLTKCISYSCKSLQAGDKCLKTWKTLHTPAVLCQA